MIFVYNETSMALKLQSITAGTKTDLKLFTDNKNNDPVVVNSTEDQIVANAMNHRYENGLELEQNPAREYILVKNTRILVDAYTRQFVISNRITDTTPEEEVKKARNLIKNMVVLVLEPKTGFYIDSKSLKTKPQLTRLADGNMVVILYIKKYNWSEEGLNLNILLENKEDASKNKKLNMTYRATVTKAGMEYKQNVIVPEDYTGEFPVFRPKNLNGGNRGHYNQDGNGYNREDRSGSGYGHSNGNRGGYHGRNNDGNNSNHGRNTNGGYRRSY